MPLAIALDLEILAPPRRPSTDRNVRPLDSRIVDSLAVGNAHPERQLPVAARVDGTQLAVLTRVERTHPAGIEHKDVPRIAHIARDPVPSAVREPSFSPLGPRRVVATRRVEQIQVVRIVHISGIAPHPGEIVVILAIGVRGNQRDPSHVGPNRQ